MTVTYTHSDCPELNPGPLTHDALASVGDALEHAARGMGPLCRMCPDPEGTTAVPPLVLAQIMGVKLSPSPELHGHGCGVLEIDYADGKTRTFEVDAQGRIEPRMYAYAVAAVIETDEPRLDEDGGEEWFDNVLSHVARALPAGFPGSVEFCSTPRPIPYRPNDDYSIQPQQEERR